MEMEDSGSTIDLASFNDSDMTSDAELAERLQMEEFESLNASDFEVARHLQEMERRNASIFLPELFMFGEAVRGSNFGHQAELWRYRPPRPPPPMPMEISETSNYDEPRVVPSEPSTDNSSEGAMSSDAQQGTTSASLFPVVSSRCSLTRRAQRSINRNRRDPVAFFAVTPTDMPTDAEQSRDTDNRREPVAAAASPNITTTRVERLREAMARNSVGHPAVVATPNFAAADPEQSRGPANRNRNRNRLGRPVVTTLPNDTANDAQELRDALNHNHLDPMAPVMPPTETAADAEQPHRNVPPPLPPRRQRRPYRNRRMHAPGVDFGLPFAGFHETLRLPGWTPNRRHYEYSRILDEDDGSGNNYEALWELSERIGEATNKGLDLIQITRLPTMKYTAPSSTMASDDMTSDNAASSSSSSESMSDATLAAMETVCRICLCNFENGEVLRALPCCHRFHVDCIDQWIKQNAICPVCRDSIKDHFKTIAHWNQ